MGTIFLDTECQALQEAARGDTDDEETVREIKIRQEEDDGTMAMIIIIGVVVVIIIILIIVVVLICKARSQNKDDSQPVPSDPAD